MRDLGRMGESAFSHWCASAGLTANGSNVDKTGWDFFVEFDFQLESSPELSTVHEAAFECRVQVKSTDKTARKLQITLSNLKRLATTAMPAFFVVIEFDGKESAQRGFLVHVDQTLTTRILSRLHDVEQDGDDDLLHKKTIAISYTASHLLADVSGAAIAAAMRRHMGVSMSEYVTRKTAYLKAAGFEDGFADLTFSADGIEDMSKLIDMSIGLEAETSISNVVAFKKRFGKRNTTPFLRESNVKLAMPDLMPNCEGTVRFKTDTLGSAFTFPGKLYVSPFNSSVPKRLRRSRIAVEFFDLIFNPSTNLCTYSFSFQGKAFDIRALKHNLAFLKMISTASQKVYWEFAAVDLPLMKFEMNSPGMQFELQEELDAVEAGLKVVSLLGICNPIHVSLAQATRNATRIIEMEKVLSPDTKAFRIDIPVIEQLLPADKDLACISFFSTPVGDLWIGVFVTIIGRQFPIETGGHSLFSTTRIIERTVVRDRGDEIRSDELIAATLAIEQKYADKYTVLTRHELQF